MPGRFGVSPPGLARETVGADARREELLLDKEVLNKVWILRKFLAELSLVEAMEFLTSKMADSKTNKKFLELMNA